MRPGSLSRVRVRTSRNAVFIVFILLFLAVTFYAAYPSLPANAAPPPWDISVTPEIVYSAPPHCPVSFIVTVTSYYKDKPIQILFDEMSEGDWQFQHGTLLSSIHFDGKGGKMPVAPDYETVVTASIVSPWEKPAGEYRVRVYAFPEGTDPFEYGVYDIITIVIVDTGVEKCDPDYWPPPPSDDDGEVIIEEDEDWPPLSDGTTDTTIDDTGGWRWWRWWDLNWKWWPYADQYWWGNWWFRWWPWATEETQETEGTFDFRLTVTPSLQTAEPGDTVHYTVDVGHLSGGSQPVSLSVSGLPAGTASLFTVPSAHPVFSSDLSITADLSLVPGTYPFTVTGNGGGKTHAVTVDLIVDEGREKSALSVSVNPPAVDTDEQVIVGGALSPPLEATIELIYTRPDGFEMFKQVVTSSDGAFSDSFAPDLAGSWTVRARWAGNDLYFGSESQPAGVSVNGASGQPSIWEMIFGILTLIIFIAVIAAIIYWLARRIKGKKKRKPLQAADSAKYCMQCGAAIPEGAKFCSQCGDKTSN